MLVIPRRSRSRSAATKLSRSSSGVASGTSRETRSCRSRMTPLRSAVRTAFDHPAVRLQGVLVHAGEREREAGRHRAVAPRPREDHGVLGGGGVKVGPERAPLLADFILRPAVAGNPLSRPEFLGLGRHQVLELLDRGDPAERYVPPRAAADVDVRVVEAGQRGAAGEIHLALSGVAVRQFVAANGQHPAVANRKGGPGRPRLVEHQNGSRVQQQVHGLRGAAGRGQDGRGDGARRARRPLRVAGGRFPVHRWISTSAASPRPR